MKAIKRFLEEAKLPVVQFIVHNHHPRNGSEHFDLRFMNPNDDKILHSFAFGKKFEEDYPVKIVGVRTKEHHPRWLTLKSYRLTTFDEGTVTVKTATAKYFELEFKGKKIKGNYRLFQLKSKRGDNWLLIKKK